MTTTTPATDRVNSPPSRWAARLRKSLRFLPALGLLALATNAQAGVIIRRTVIVRPGLIRPFRPVYVGPRVVVPAVYYRPGWVYRAGVWARR
jgi:hypothetical protein